MSGICDFPKCLSRFSQGAFERLQLGHCAERCDHKRNPFVHCGFTISSLASNPSSTVVFQSVRCKRFLDAFPAIIFALLSQNETTPATTCFLPQPPMPAATTVEDEATWGMALWVATATLCIVLVPTRARDEGAVSRRSQCGAQGPRRKQRSANWCQTRPKNID